MGPEKGLELSDYGMVCPTLKQLFKMKTKNRKPSRIATYLLRLSLPKPESSFLLGDYEEEYNYLCETKGIIYTRIWFWILVLESIPGFVLNQIYWRIIMYKNFMKVAFKI